MKWRKIEDCSSITNLLANYFAEDDSFSLKEAENVALNIFHKKVKLPSIRARIYEGISNGKFEKLSRGVYKVVTDDGNKCLLVEGDGRDLSRIQSNSIDAIITDHPYDLKKQLKGGNRDFASYSLFQYEQSDFDEKFRVLKEGGFLVEFIPEESEVNFEYLYKIKQFALKSGFKYYSKVPWIKGKFVANTGRKSKNAEDMIFFTKGEPRKLKLDTKKNLATLLSHGINAKGKPSEEIKDMLIANNLEISYMKGCSGMLPTEFNFQPESKKDKVMEAAKPIELLETLLDYISLPGELILDQFGGSGNIAVACMNKKRNCIVIEQDDEMYNKMRNNILSHVYTF